MEQTEKQLIKHARTELKSLKVDTALMVLAAILAAFAIYKNDNFVLIGSMIIAPFFDPLISFCIFLIEGKTQHLFKTLKVFIFLFIIGIVVAVLTFIVIQVFGGDITIAEYVPNFDFSYFFVAIILGIGAGIFWVWPEASETATGMSVAISLIPPLVNSGRGLITNQPGVFTDSIVLFFLNTLGIIIGAILVFWYKKNRKG
jgi:uncharacterized hydrophobic protein (TIGR00271 family)